MCCGAALFEGLGAVPVVVQVRVSGATAQGWSSVSGSAEVGESMDGGEDVVAEVGALQRLLGE